MAAVLAFTDWYWGARGGFFIIFALVSLITRLAARGRRSAKSRTSLQPFGQPGQQPFQQQGFPQQGFPQQGFPQQGFPQQGFPQQGFPQQDPAQPGYAQQQYMQPQYTQPPFTQQPPPPEQPRIARPNSPMDGPRTNPQNPFSAGPSDRPRSTPLPDTFGD